ncbi:hypothetical protein Q7P36_007107 [Cladosporium allicinum]
MSIKPLTLWGHWGAPNPFKVCIVLEALGLPYGTRLLELSDVKQESYVKLNPNGRLPTLQDPNTGLDLSESGAIIQYLVDQYDKDHAISYDDVIQKYQTQQWLAFQISGQGPYYGQATWFARFHSEKIPSAIERYTNEIERVISVLDLGLEKTGTGWLVGEKCTFADLSFVTWNLVGEGLLKELGKLQDLDVKYPNYAAWMDALCKRDDPWPGDNQHPSFHHRRLGYTPLGLTDRPTDCIRLSPTEYSVDVQPYEASDERPLSQHNSRLTTSISIHTHTTMSTLTKRQSPLDDTGSNPNYDNYDNYGYDPSTCYQEHTCSWWWSSTGSAVRYTIVSILFFLLIAYFFGGYLHARARLRKNLPPLSYHRWMVSKRHNPHHHPRYYYNPQNPHNNNHPMYNQNPYYGNGQQHPDMIGMQGGMNPPPPPAYNAGGCAAAGLSAACGGQ